MSHKYEVVMKAKDPYTKGVAAFSELFIGLRQGFLLELGGDEEDVFGGVIQDPKFCSKMTSVAVAHAYELVKSLPYLISLLKLSYVDADLNEENFPYQLIDSCLGQRQWRLFNFKKSMSPIYVTAEMQKENFRPATPREKLRWAKNNWNGTDWIVALGQTWRHLKKQNEYATVLRFKDGERRLELELVADVGVYYGSAYKFLGIKK